VTASPRIYLSPPDSGQAEVDAVVRAVTSGWLAPLGPEVDAFEAEVAAVAGRAYAAATNSGTAALQLALRLAGVVAGSEVVIPTLTFVATANAAHYLGARPVFLDVDPETWTLDPELLAEELDDAARHGRSTSAVVAVDLYGQCADYDRLTEVCRRHDVPLVLDSAEALGATYRDRPAGSAGLFAIFSFNGNKIITTSGGGMLVGDDEDAIAQARSLAAQAREPGLQYEHRSLGYNYRLSNVLAAIGRAQLGSLTERVDRRRAVNATYRARLGDLPGLHFQPVAAYGRPTHWLSVISLSKELEAGPLEVVGALGKANIEARPGWMPMHLQPTHLGSRTRGGKVAEDVFARSVCLPSGSSLTPADQERVIDVVREVVKG